MNIYLTGYMASGKSLIGSLLAEALAIPFYDLDDYIVRTYSQTIPEIFEKEGEVGFRQKEAEALRSLPATQNAIISCGGGTFCFPQNREWIKEQGIAIYLKVSPEILANRLSGDQAERPIIKANKESPEDLLEFINKQFLQRQEHYNQADIIYKAEGSPSEIVSELRHYFQRFMK